MPKLAELQKSRSIAVEKMVTLADLDTITAEQQVEYDGHRTEVKRLDEQMGRIRESQALMAAKAQPVEGQPRRSPAAPITDAYAKDDSLSVGAGLKMFARAKGNIFQAVDFAAATYGEGHPVMELLTQAKALATTSGTSGGFVVPPDFMGTIIELLYNRTVVRKAGTLVLPMPNGTMTVPKMTGGSSAQWVGEGQQIGNSQQSFGQVTAVAHKLAALVPVTNDQMRYATPAFDGMIRDDIVTQIAVAEDAAYIRGQGTAYSPKGMRTLCLPTAFINSASVFTLVTVSGELGQAVTNLETANLPMAKVGWLMSPRSKNFLLNLLNANGFFVYKDEMSKGTLLGYPFSVTNQIPNNLVYGANADCSEIYFGDFSQMMILESRQMEFAISTEATYTDANGNKVSAFENDMTLLRGLMAVDFQTRHDEAVTIIQGVRWKAQNS